MRPLQPKRRSRAPYLLPMLSALALLLVVAACGPSTPQPPLPTDAPSGVTPPQATQTPQASQATQEKDQASSLPVGVDADGNFYRGNPNAPVKLVEFSEFQ